MRFLLAVALCAAAHAQTPTWPPAGVPASFDCGMRAAAYEYGRVLLPRFGAFDSLYYALGLNALPGCTVPHGPLPANHTATAATSTASASLNRHAKHLQPPPRHSGPRPYVLPHDSQAVFVAPLLSSAAPTAAAVDGTRARPYRSLQDAADAAAARGLRHVLLAPGTYFLKQPLLLTPRHSGITFGPDSADGVATSAPPSQRRSLSGGVALPSLAWVVHNTSGGKNIWRTQLPTSVAAELHGFPGLQLNGRRLTRARYPNLPAGIEVSPGYGYNLPGQVASWTPPQFSRYGEPRFYTDTTHVRNNTPNGWFQDYMIGIDGLCTVYDPPVSYWCSEHPSGGGAFAFRTPSGITPGAGVLPNLPYKNPKTGLFFVWRPARWANWMFEVDHAVAAGDKGTESAVVTVNFTFGKGGNQGARGSDDGGDWFVENVLEELDWPGEWFYDEGSMTLYVYYNGTGSPPATGFVVPQQRVLVNVSGSQWNPVTNVSIVGLQLVASRYTYMDAHGVPSGGDWALDRQGAVFLQGTEEALVEQCVFDALDGNGVMISGYNRYTTVRDSDFSFIGGNSIASWGYTNETASDPGRPGVVNLNWPQAGVDGTDGEHPRFNRIVGNSAREVGLYEKQSSFYVQAKTIGSTLTGNVFFNGPRAGVNFNDGFGGGDEISNNLIFSTCRESGDHGPFNSWDRQPYITSARTGSPSLIMQWRRIHHNFLIDNYSPQEAVDNDDGSAYYETYSNFLVYGDRGMKNDFGGHDNHHFSNIYGYVDEPLGTTSTLDGHEDYFYSNTVVMRGNDVGEFTCDGVGKTVMYGNSYYTPTGALTECGMSFQRWQARGEEAGSTLSTWPRDAAILSAVKALLGY